MGFFAGRLTYTRYRVVGAVPGTFDADHLERLREHAIGKQRIANADGAEIGWTAGDHILDTDFTLEKNVVNDALHFALRIDANKIPADLLAAYAQVDVKAFAAGNPSGFASKRQKREAKEAARERLEDQAKDGRFIKRKAVPVLWDAQSNELLLGATAASVADRFLPLVEATFGVETAPLGAGAQSASARMALRNGESSQLLVDGLSPFVPGLTPAETAWRSGSDLDFLGNEYLLWLWFMLDADNDSIALPDGSAAVVMLTKTLALECPRGQSGKETFTDDGPTRLPEARRAIQAGKLPRKAGMIVVRHDQQYELTLAAETLAVSGAELPALEASEPQARREERVTQVRHLTETLDLMYGAFIRLRAGDGWGQELGRMQRWLWREEKTRATA